LVQPGFEGGNPGLEVSILSTEFCDETLLFDDEAFEILNGCKKNRDIHNGVLRESGPQHPFPDKGSQQSLYSI